MKWCNIVQISMFDGVNLFTIFTTGLLTGGLTCLAVQGGLLTAMLAQRESALATVARKEATLKERLINNGHILPILSFLVAKLFAYTVLGFFLGWLGSLIQPSLQVRVVLQIAVVVFMLGTALNLLNVHPIFRYFVIQPPHFLTRLIRKQSKRTDLFAPAALGAFTVFIPCGVTQAMMALAIAAANPFVGAVILFVFVLGTSPLFFLLGYLTLKLGDVLQKSFLKVAAAIIILLALYNLDGALALTGTQYTFTNVLKVGYCVISYCDGEFLGIAVNQTPVSEQTITFTNSGYTPNNFAVKAGEEVTLHLVNENAGGCVQGFTIPALNIQEIVPQKSTRDITFTAPPEATLISFTCSMGMYPGTIRVVE